MKLNCSPRAPHDGMAANRNPIVDDLDSRRDGRSRPKAAAAAAIDLREFELQMRMLLTSSERRAVFQAVRDYRTSGRLDALIRCLRSTLDTPAKLDLLVHVRRFVDASQRRIFDSVVPYHNMAHYSCLEPEVRVSGEGSRNRHQRGRRSDGGPPAVVRSCVPSIASPARCLQLERSTLPVDVTDGEMTKRDVLFCHWKRNSRTSSKFNLLRATCSQAIRECRNRETV